ncbi:MAG: hypothetical protein Q9163_003229 [Psora crenata]
MASSGMSYPPAGASPRSATSANLGAMASSYMGSPGADSSGMGAVDPALVQASMGASPQGKVPHDAFRVLIWLSWLIAVLASIGRTVIRIRMKKGFQLDDAFLALALTTLTAGTALLYVGRDALYTAQALLINPMLALTMDNIMPDILLYQKVYLSALSLTWVTIFTVKIAFLHLFRQLICRMPRMIRCWWIVAVATALSFVFCFCDTFISCFKIGMDANIVSDLLIVAISIVLIYQVRIAPRHKAGLCLFLCLQIFIAIIAIIRVSGIRVSGAKIAGMQSGLTFDYPWTDLWQQIEASIAVALFSFTAFRSVFIADGSRVVPSPESPQRWYYSPVERVKKIKRGRQDGEIYLSSGDFGKRFPVIPNLTMTGMRSFAQVSHRDSYLETGLYPGNGGTFTGDDGDTQPLQNPPTRPAGGI